MEELEAKINNKIYKFKKTSKVLSIFSTFLVIISLITFVKNVINFKINFNFFIYFIIATVLVVFQITHKKKLFREIKEEIFNSILSDLNDKKFIYTELGMPKNEFAKSGIYKSYTDYYTSDGLKTFLNDIYIANVTAVKKTEERKENVFQGVFGYVMIEDYYENEVIIKPDVENKYVSNVLNSSKKIIGNDENIVRLENGEFEKYFEVYSKNQIKAREIITPIYMENLLKIRNKFNAPIKIIYKEEKKEDKQVSFAIWNARIIDEKDIYKSGLKINDIKEKLKGLINILNEC